MAIPPRIDICAQYDKIARWFDENRGKSETMPEMKYLAQIVAAFADGGHALDLGCGTAEPVAAFLIKHGWRVTGIDGSAEMIALCRERFPGMNWVIRDMRRIALGRTFDAVVAWDSFFHLPSEEQPAMFPVFAAHTAPGGLLLFTSGPDGASAQGVMNDLEFSYGSLPPNVYKALLTDNGFELLDHIIGDPAKGEHTIWFARRLPDEG